MLLWLLLKTWLYYLVLIQFFIPPQFPSVSGWGEPISPYRYKRRWKLLRMAVIQHFVCYYIQKNNSSSRSKKDVADQRFISYLQNHRRGEADIADRLHCSAMSHDWHWSVLSSQRYIDTTFIFFFFGCLPLLFLKNKIKNRCPIVCWNRATPKGETWLSGAVHCGRILFLACLARILQNGDVARL